LGVLPPEPKLKTKKTHAMPPSCAPPPFSAESPPQSPPHIINTMPTLNQGEVNGGIPDVFGEHDSTARTGVFLPSSERMEEYQVVGSPYEVQRDFNMSCDHPQEIERMDALFQAKRLTWERMEDLYKTEKHAWNVHTKTTAVRIAKLEYDLSTATGGLNFYKKQLAGCIRSLETAAAAKETSGLVIKALELELKGFGVDSVAIKKQCLANRPPSKVVRTLSQKRKRMSINGDDTLDQVAKPVTKRQKGASIGRTPNVEDLYPPLLVGISLDGKMGDFPDETQQNPNDQTGTESYEEHKGDEGAEDSTESYEEHQGDEGAEDSTESYEEHQGDEEAGDSTGRGMGNEFAHSASDTASEPGNQEHLVSGQDPVSVDQVGGGSLGDGAGSFLNHSEEGSAPPPNKEGTLNTAVNSNLQIPSEVSQEIKQEPGEEASGKIKDEPSEFVRFPGHTGGMEGIIYINLSDEEESPPPEPSPPKRKSKRKNTKKGNATISPSRDGDPAPSE
jgi:hypothetical protein